MVNKKSRFRIILCLTSIVFIISAFTVWAAPKAETVTITFSTGKDVTGAKQAGVAAFEKKYPNIKVKYLEMPSSTNDQHNAAVTALTAGDSSVDVYCMDIAWTAEFGSAGWILPLNKYFKTKDRKEFFEGPLSTCVYNGKTYAVPFYTDSGILYYRTDLMPKPPTTWQELYDISEKLMSENKVKYGFVFQGDQYEGMICNALEYIWSNGGDVLKGKKIQLNSPKSVEGLKIFKNMLKIAPEGVVTYQENDALVAFQEGRAAFMRNWPFAWSRLNAATSLVKGKVGIVPVPRGPKGKFGGTGTLGGYNLGINKYSKHPDAAWTFVNYMCSEKNQTDQALIAGRLPARKNVYNHPEVLKANPHFKVMFDVFQNAKPRPVSPFYTQMSGIMQIYFHKVLTNQASAETAIRQAAKEMQDLLKKIN